MNCNHKFKPRYEYRFPAWLKTHNFRTSNIESLKEEVYVRDVCVKCGQTIERENKSQRREFINY